MTIQERLALFLQHESLNYKQLRLYVTSEMVQR